MRRFINLYKKIKKDHPLFIKVVTKISPVHFWTLYDYLSRKTAKEKIFYHTLAESKFVVDFTDKNKFMRWIMENYLMLDEYEPETTKIVKNIVKEGDIVIDIGASIGYFTFLTSKIIGERGKVYAFEPTEQGFNYLCRNKIANKADNVYPYKMAAWDKDEITFVPLNAEGQNRIWANGVAIGDFIKDKIDFIKCDVDGAEPWVLKGLIKIFEKSPNLKMIFEYYPKYIEDAGGDPKEVLAILDKYFTYKKIEGDYGGTYWNLLCIKK